MTRGCQEASETNPSLHGFMSAFDRSGQFGYGVIDPIDFMPKL